LLLPEKSSGRPAYMSIRMVVVDISLSSGYSELLSELEELELEGGGGESECNGEE